MKKIIDIRIYHMHMLIQKYNLCPKFRLTWQGINSI